MYIFWISLKELGRSVLLESFVDEFVVLLELELYQNTAECDYFESWGLLELVWMLPNRNTGRIRKAFGSSSLFR